MKLELKIVNSKIGSSFAIPKKQTRGSAAIDLIACIDEPINIESMESILVPSGIAIYIKDPNYVGLIVPRSGLGHKHGIVMGNNVGLIDSDYQGELKISLLNRKKKTYVVQPGDRIAQYLVVPVLDIELCQVEEFSDATDRGASGFGHTGKQ